MTSSISIALWGAIKASWTTMAVSRSNYWAAYIIDFATPALFLWIATLYEISVPLTALCFAAGALIFSLIEYAIHRWMFHSPSCFMSSVHQDHHDVPGAATALPYYTAPGSLTLLCLLFSTVIGMPAALPVTAGIAFGYLWYSLLHHLTHSPYVQHPWVRLLRKRHGMHQVHHRLGMVNFGVTTSLWDHVFGTYYLSRSRKRARVIEPAAAARSPLRADTDRRSEL